MTLLDRCGNRLLPSHPLLFRGLSLSFIVVLVVTTLIIQGRPKLELATQMARRITAHQSTNNHDNPWGGVQLAMGAEETVVDFQNVPLTACPEFMQHLQCLPGVKRLAVGTQAKDETPVPLAFSDIAWRCVGIQSHTVRLIMHTRPVESGACQEAK
jgi:hypothetical protein